MANPTTGELVLRNVWDEDTKSLKVIINSNDFAIELDHEDGDSVNTHPASQVVSDLSEQSCVGMKTGKLYAEAGSGAAKVQVSPVDSGDVWMDLSSAKVTAGASVAASSHFTLCARRVRIVLTSGTPVCHLVMQGI